MQASKHDFHQLQQFGVHLFLLPGLKFSPGAEEQPVSIKQGFNWRKMIIMITACQNISNSTLESHQGKAVVLQYLTHRCIGIKNNIIAHRCRNWRWGYEGHMPPQLFLPCVQSRI